MSSDFQHKRASAVENLAARIRDLISLDLDLLRKREVDTFAVDFGDVIPAFQLAKEYAQRVPLERLLDAPRPLIDHVSSPVSQLLQYAGEIRNFPVRDPKADRLKSDLITRIVTATESLGEKIAPLLAFLSDPLAAFERLESRVKSLTDETQHASAAAQALIDSKLAALESVLKSLSEQAGSAAVKDTTKYFSAEADSHGKSAERWLAAAALLSLATGSFAWWSLEHAIGTQAADGSRVAQLAVAKLIAFSLLSLAVLWCGRNYRAHCHNRSVYRHRYNALQTFDKFVNSTQDERVKSAILLQAAQAAFGQRSTGFDRADKEPVSPLSGLIERAMGSSSQQ